MIGANVSAFSIGKAVGRGGGNLAPVITSSPVTTANVSTAYSYQVQATDPEGGSLSYSLPTKPTGMTISGSGLVQWTPSNVGSDAVVVRVTDNEGAFTDQAYSITVSAQLTLLWNNNSGQDVIAQQSGNFIRYGVPSNTANPMGSWQYQAPNSSTWVSFQSSTMINLGSQILRTSNGALYQYIHLSSNWSAGNQNYLQRYYPSNNVAGNGYSYGETAALANNAGNFGTASNYSFF